MNNDTKKNLTGFFLFVLIAAVVSAGARCAMTLLYLDESYGVYQAGIIFPTLTHILTFVLCAAAAVIGLLLSKDLPCPVMPEPGSGVVFASSVTAFLIAASSLYTVYNIITGVLTAEKLTIAKLIVSVPAIIFFLALMRPQTRKSPVFAFMSFFPTVWFALAIVEVYFDRTLLITSPAKTFRQLAILSIMLFLLNESRAIIGRQNGILYLVTSGVAPIIVITSSLPALIFSEKLMIGQSDDFLCYAVELAAAVFILARGFSFAKSPSTLPKPEKKPKEDKKSKN